MDICKYCGGKFVQNQSAGRKKKYCSKKCGDKFKQGIPQNYYGENYYLCEGCNKKFFSLTKKKYCSGDCWKKTYLQNAKILRKDPDYKRKIYLKNKACIRCNTNFESETSKVKYCNECAQIVCAERLKNLTNEKEKRECLWCGKVFIAAKVFFQRFCSKRCSDALNSKIKRARKKKVFKEIVNLNDIYVRDNGICYLCNENIDKTLKHPHPLSLSIDHVVPISKGGLHSYENIKIAHLKCNILKGSRILIGGDVCGEAIKVN